MPGGGCDPGVPEHDGRLKHARPSGHQENQGGGGVGSGAMAVLQEHMTKCDRRQRRPSRHSSGRRLPMLRLPFGVIDISSLRGKLSVARILAPLVEARTVRGDSPEKLLEGTDVDDPECAVV